MKMMMIEARRDWRSQVWGDFRQAQERDYLLWGWPPWRPCWCKVAFSVCFLLLPSKSSLFFFSFTSEFALYSQRHDWECCLQCWRMGQTQGEAFWLFQGLGFPPEPCANDGSCHDWPPAFHWTPQENSGNPQYCFFPPTLVVQSTCLVDTKD